MFGRGGPGGCRGSTFLFIFSYFSLRVIHIYNTYNYLLARCKCATVVYTIYADMHRSELYIHPMSSAMCVK